MVNDSANVQPTDDTDPETEFDLILYGNKPERQEEIVQLKRLRVVPWVWALVGFFAMLSGLLLLGRFVSTPILIGLAALWAISIWAETGREHALVKEIRIKIDHYWQDRHDRDWLRLKENLLDPLDRLREENELYLRADQIIAAEYETQEQERRDLGRRGRGKDTGRPETTREEWIQRGRKIIEVEEYHNRQQISYEQACARAGVVYSTFRDWRRKIPEDCLNEARARLTRN